MKLPFRFYWLGISFEGHEQLANDITLNLAAVCRQVPHSPLACQYYHLLLELTDCLLSPIKPSVFEYLLCSKI